MGGSQEPSRAQAVSLVRLSGEDIALVAALAAALQVIGWDTLVVETSSAPTVPTAVGPRRHVVVLGSADRLPDTVDWARLAELRSLTLGSGDLVVVVGPRSTARSLVVALNAGAAVALDSEQAFSNLLPAVDRALRREVHQRARLVDVLRAQVRASDTLDRLSPREQLVLTRLVEGLTAAEIARRDHVSLTTVRSHIRGILTKLGVTSQLAAVTLAHTHAHRDPVAAALRRIHQF